MPGPKTNERPGTRAVHRHARVAPNKVREVLNLIRGATVADAADILRFSERDAAILVGKVLASAVANAENNDGQDPEELYVSACFADEGTTIKRWRPRARGRATRIRKRTSHITVIVSRLPEDRLARLQARRQAEQAVRRARRVAGARRTAEAGGGRGRLGRRRGGAEVEAAATGMDAAVAEAAAEAVEHAGGPGGDLDIAREAVLPAAEELGADDELIEGHDTDELEDVDDDDVEDHDTTNDDVTNDDATGVDTTEDDTTEDDTTEDHDTPEAGTSDAAHEQKDE